MTWIFALWSLACSAHVPEFGTVTARAADQHGRGAYQIDQDVTFRKGSDVYAVKETWTVLGEGNLRVVLEGRGNLRGLAQGVIVYEGGTKAFAEPGQSVRSARLGDEWLEPLFHFRFGKWFRNRLVALKVAPAEALDDRPPLPAEGEINYTRPGFMRLGRAGGAIAYVIGTPPEVNPNAPTLWIAQDDFTVLKYRSANQLVVHADDYFKESGLRLPRRRTFNFGPFEVQAVVTGVKPLGKLTATDPRFRSGSIAPARDALKIPDVDIVREFYSRFR